MTKEMKAAGREIERAEKALRDAIEAGDKWAEAQNRRAVRAARAYYAVVAS